MVPPLSCVVRTNYFDRLVVATVGPVAVSALIYFFYKLALRAPSASKLADWVKHEAFTAWLALTFFICALSQLAAPPAPFVTGLSFHQTPA